MPLRVQCPNGCVMRVPANRAGMSARCPGCKSVVVIPFPPTSHDPKDLLEAVIASSSIVAPAEDKLAVASSSETDPVDPSLDLTKPPQKKKKSPKAKPAEEQSSVVEEPKASKTEVAAKTPSSVNRSPAAEVSRPKKKRKRKKKPAATTPNPTIPKPELSSEPVAKKRPKSDLDNPVIQSEPSRQKLSSPIPPKPVLEPPKTALPKPVPSSDPIAKEQNPSDGNNAVIQPETSKPELSSPKPPKPKLDPPKTRTPEPGDEPSQAPILSEQGRIKTPGEEFRFLGLVEVENPPFKELADDPAFLMGVPDRNAETKPPVDEFPNVKVVEAEEGLPEIRTSNKSNEALATFSLDVSEDSGDAKVPGETRKDPLGLSAIEIRTRRANADRVTLTRFFAALLLFVGVVNFAPSIYCWYTWSQNDIDFVLPRWIYLQIFIAILHLVYAVLLLQVPDWSTLRSIAVVMLVFAFVFGLFSMGLLATGSNGLLAQFLQVPGSLGRQACIWCVAMLCLATLASYLAGRESNAWQRTEKLLAEILANKDAV